MIGVPAGKALVICGAAGSGKSSLAQLIARQMSTKTYDAHDPSTFPAPRVCTCEQLSTVFKPFLADSPEVLIVEEFNESKDINDLINLVSTCLYWLNLQGKEPCQIQRPKHIIVCSDLSADFFDYDQFVTLTIGGALCHMPC